MKSDIIHYFIRFLNENDAYSAYMYNLQEDIYFKVYQGIDDWFYKTDYRMFIMSGFSWVGCCYGESSFWSDLHRKWQDASNKWMCDKFQI